MITFFDCGIPIFAPLMKTQVMQRDPIDLRSAAVGRLFRRFLGPHRTGDALFGGLYLTDGIFVGPGAIGSDALAAVNIAAPLFTLGTGWA